MLPIWIVFCVLCRVFCVEGTSVEARSMEWHAAWPVVGRDTVMNVMIHSTRDAHGESTRVRLSFDAAFWFQGRCQPWEAHDAERSGTRRAVTQRLGRPLSRRSAVSLAEAHEAVVEIK